jgi:hypothetical protein
MKQIYSHFPSSTGSTGSFLAQLLAIGVIFGFAMQAIATPDLKKELEFFGSPELIELERSILKANYLRGVEIGEVIEGLKISFPSPTDQVYLDKYLLKHGISPKTILKVKSLTILDETLSLKLLNGRKVTIVRNGSGNVSLNGITIEVSGVSAEYFLNKIKSALRATFVAKKNQLVLPFAFASTEHHSVTIIAQIIFWWRGGLLGSLDRALKECEREINKRDYGGSGTEKMLGVYLSNMKDANGTDRSREILALKDGPGGINCWQFAIKAPKSNEPQGKPKFDSDDKEWCVKFSNFLSCATAFKNPKDGKKQEPRTPTIK